MRGIRTRLLLILLLLVLLGVGSFGFFTYQVQQVPQFYQQAIARSPQEQFQHGEQFEAEAIELQNQLRRSGQWQLELAADDVNGWLATVLPEKFPQALPEEVHDPRVAMEPDRLLAACTYQTVGIDTVVSVELEPYLTDKPNELAIRVHRVAAGALPVPLAQYLEQITAAAAEHGVVIRWQEVEGDPLALITLVLTDADDQRNISVTALEVLPGKLSLSGQVEEPLPPQPLAPPTIQAVPSVDSNEASQN